MHGAQRQQILLYRFDLSFQPPDGSISIHNGYNIWYIRYVKQEKGAL